jgi:hypothetical protein
VEGNAAGRRTSGFTKIPNRVVCDPSLSANAFRVLAALACHQRNNDSCWPHQDLIARETGLSVRTVQRAVKELTDAGYLERDRRWRGNEYTVCLDRPATGGGSQTATGDIPATDDGTTAATGGGPKEVEESEIDRSAGAHADGGAITQSDLSTKKIVSDYVRAARDNGHDPTREFINATAAGVARLKDEGIDPETIQQAATVMGTKGIAPGEIDMLVFQEQNRQGRERRLAAAREQEATEQEATETSPGSRRSYSRDEWFEIYRDWYIRARGCEPTLDDLIRGMEMIDNAMYDPRVNSNILTLIIDAAMTGEFWSPD